MADLKLNDLRKYAIEQEASVLMKSRSYDRMAEVNKHGIIQWVRTEKEKNLEWFPSPVGITFEKILHDVREFVVQRPQAKPVTYTPEQFAAQLLPPSASKAAQGRDEEE